MLSAVYRQPPVRVPAVAGPRSARVPWPVSYGAGPWVALCHCRFSPLALWQLRSSSSGIPCQTPWAITSKASRSYTETIAIAGTSDDVLDQSERFRDFSYAIPVANGDCLVTLKFKEEGCR